MIIDAGRVYNLKSVLYCLCFIPYPITMRTNRDFNNFLVLTLVNNINILTYEQTLIYDFRRTLYLFYT